MANSIQWLNYHDGLFLELAEFKLEQDYHLYMRQRLNYAIFNPGVLYGLNLVYNAGVLKVTAGMAVDETLDALQGPIGREIALMNDSSPVDLSGFHDGDPVWITIGYDFTQDTPKAPTLSTPSRNTLQVRLETHAADPGTGKEKILLGKLVKGTGIDAGVVPQKASLRLGGTVPAPTVSSFTPANGPAGTVVTVTGSNLTGVTGVSFGGVAASTFAATSNTQIAVTVPAGAITGKIKVTTFGGFIESASNFTVSAAGPTISGFSPVSGLTGASIVITGTNFINVTGVSFGGVPSISYTPDSNTQITAIVPAGAVTGKIRVAALAGNTESAANFTVSVPLPQVTSFTPDHGGVGAPVTITGNNFTGATAVQFGGVNAPGIVVNSATQITVPVPAGAATGKISVTTLAGTGTSAGNFTVTPAIKITSLSPSLAGDPLTGLQASGGALDILGQNIYNNALTPGQPATGTVVNLTDGNNTRQGLNPTVRPSSGGMQVVRIVIPARTGTPWGAAATVSLKLEFGGGTATASFKYDD